MNEIIISFDGSGLLNLDRQAVVTQDNGQVCALQLYHGRRCISLDELEANATAEAGSTKTAELQL